MLIGIMGKTGSGKSTITKALNKDNKFDVLDVDKINHKLLENPQLKEEIIKRYLTVVENNKINRKKLAIILYNDKDKMQEYNTLIWQYLEKKLDEIIANSTKPVIIDWMMLPLTKFYNMCNIKILVESDICIRQKRIEARDSVDKEHFLSRDKNGLDYERNDMDFIVNNDKGIDEHEIKSIRKCITLYKK